MTLVIAKKNSNSIRIFSDTKKTDLTDVLKGISRSVLKSVILNRNLCVCFAGRIGYAYSSIQKLSGIIKQGYDDLDKAKDFLLKENQDSNNNVDFIIASLAPKFSLVKISDSKVEEVIDQCWIGNIDAFDDYQRRFHSTPGLDRGSLSKEEEVNLNTIYRMNRAFKRLVESEKHGDVGEFMIEVASSPDGFYYEPTCLSFPGSKAISPNTSAGLNEFFSSTGSYSYSILTPESTGVGAVGIQFYPGNVGALFYPVTLDTPLIYRNVSESELIDKIFTEYQIKLKSVLLE